MKHLKLITSKKPVDAVVNQGLFLDILEKQLLKLAAELPAKLAEKLPE